MTGSTGSSQLTSNVCIHTDKICTKFEPWPGRAGVEIFLSEGFPHMYRSSSRGIGYDDKGKQEEDEEDPDDFEDVDLDDDDDDDEDDEEEEEEENASGQEYDEVLGAGTLYLNPKQVHRIRQRRQERIRGIDHLLRSPQKKPKRNK